MNLEGKTALVVGGGTGIGYGIAKALANAGCRVAISGRREETLREASASANTKTPLLFHPADAGERASVNDLVAWATDELGRVDVLVNSAGINIKTRKMTDMTPDQWDQVMRINSTGAYNCMHAVLPQMRERRDGLIINVSSIAGLRASALGGVAYAASKFAMAALSTAVANELGPEGIRVTSVYPGEVNTPILDNRPNPVSDDHKAAILQPEDFGNVIVAIAALPPRAHVSDIVIKPTHQEFT
ncbi:MAG: SDR family oxidoreductase [Planctomycetes bacterium]|nr:SDR family oxidoreductase [Planctomycetota bacterium]